jgi:hypothetical protein
MCSGVLVFLSQQAVSRKETRPWAELWAEEKEMRPVGSGRKRKPGL